MILEKLGCYEKALGVLRSDLAGECACIKTNFSCNEIAQAVFL